MILFVIMFALSSVGVIIHEHPYLFFPLFLCLMQSLARWYIRSLIGLVPTLGGYLALTLVLRFVFRQSNNDNWNEEGCKAQQSSLNVKLAGFLITAKHYQDLYQALAFVAQIICSGLSNPISKVQLQALKAKLVLGLRPSAKGRGRYIFHNPCQMFREQIFIIPVFSTSNAEKEQSLDIGLPLLKIICRFNLMILYDQLCA